MLREIAGTRINVIDEGEGEAIVFLHSNTFSWRNWIPQLDGLRDRYRCIAIDIRGYGGSDRRDPMTIERYADDAADVCAALELTRAHVVGISLGGIVAQTVAVRHPGLVDRLVLANTSSGGDPAVADRVRQAAVAIRAEGLERVLEASFEATFSADFQARHPGEVQALRREFESTDPLSVAATSESLIAYDYGARLGEIAAPTLVLYGDADRMMKRSDSEELARRIPDARLVTIAGVGHLSNLEAPEEFNRALVAFLEDRGRGEGQEPGPTNRAQR